MKTKLLGFALLALAATFNAFAQNSVAERDALTAAMARTTEWPMSF